MIEAIRDSQIERDSEASGMTTTEANTQPRPPPVQGLAARQQQWPTWMVPILDDWRRRWPTVFTKPVPLAVGIRQYIREALQAEGISIDDKTAGVALHMWTMQSAYLRAVASGVVRHNLDGSKAGIPDQAARQYAQEILQERATRRAERKQRQQEKRAARENSL